jgi:lipoprotein signal peptidase
VTPRVQDNPSPLVVAASLAAVEGALVVLYALGELRNLSSERLSAELAIVAFLALYGAALLYCSWQLSRARTWARGPVLLSQLLQLGVAWSFWGGSTTWLSVTLAVVALIVLAGLLHPQSIDALNDEQPERR